MAAIRYIAWSEDALVAEAARVRGIASPSMADRGRLSRINAELARRTPEHQRPNDWMASGYWLEHAAGPEAKGSPDTVTRKPNRLLAVYRRWLGAGFDEAIGYADPLWGVEVARRATVAKDRLAVMGQIQRQEFQHFERAYAQRVLNAMPAADARTRTDAEIRRAVRKVVSDLAAPTDAARDLRRIAMGNAKALAAWTACEADGRNLPDDLERAIFDVCTKWIVARKPDRTGEPGPWLLERRDQDAGFGAVIRAAAKCCSIVAIAATLAACVTQATPLPPQSVTVPPPKFAPVSSMPTPAARPVTLGVVRASATCFETTVVSPTPFMGNNEEIFKISDGSIWEIKYEYQYLYEYNPNVVLCPGQGRLIIKGKSLAVASLVSSPQAGGGRMPVSQSGVLESSIDGEFNGWEGETIFRLRNGQIWQQSQYAYHYHYAYSPRVLIFPRGGRYEMSVEGVGDRIAVVRLR